MTWTRKDIDGKLSQLRDTADLWPRNPIPLRANLNYYCANKRQTASLPRQPCVRCDGRDPVKIWGDVCKFWNTARYRPIVLVWQLEYIIPMEVLRLKLFLEDGEWLYGHNEETSYS